MLANFGKYIYFGFYTKILGGGLRRLGHFDISGRLKHRKYRASAAQGVVSAAHGPPKPLRARNRCSWLPPRPLCARNRRSSVPPRPLCSESLLQCASESSETAVWQQKQVFCVGNSLLASRRVESAVLHRMQLSYIENCCLAVETAVLHRQHLSCIENSPLASATSFWHRR